MDKRLGELFEFFKEIDKEKSIYRQNYIADGSRKENDAEHAWHMAIMAILLSDYSNEPIDVLKTVTMLLIHDIVEIDAGDTYAYNEDAKKTQRERELMAADRIFNILPEPHAKKLRDIWDEFEACYTPEARFARTLDNVQPAMLNYASDGKSWMEHDVKLGQVLKRNENTELGSKKIWEYSKNNFIEPGVSKGYIKEE